MTSYPFWVEKRGNCCIIGRFWCRAYKFESDEYKADIETERG